MHRNGRIALLLAITFVGMISIAFLPPIHQDLSYHLFADKRTVSGIPSFWNVVTNLPFLVIGIYGLAGLAKQGSFQPIYAAMFVGIFLTGIGSGYYHWQPGNNTLVYDRIPMTIVFMSFLSLTIAQCIDDRRGTILLFPLAFVGIASVVWWHYTDDLRWYGLVQFYPVVLTPLIYLLFPSDQAKKSWRLLKWVVLWYIIAKIFEHFDGEIFQAGYFISGHSLKHLAASVSCYYLVKMYREQPSPCR